jgi:hypothetical protein
MLRFLRVAGIVVFALLVGIAANNLWNMHLDGNLTERYNSARKANITLVFFSLAAVGVLGYFELYRMRSIGRGRVPYGRRHRAEADEGRAITDGTDTANIYSAPPTVDDWKGRRTRSSKSRQKQRMEQSGIWLWWLRICCVAVPLIYGSLLAKTLLAPADAQELPWLLPAALGAMVLFSAVTAIGLLARKAWGMALGYVVAICNLMVFPFGTVLGLFLIMGLAGSSAEFMVPDSKKRRAARRKASERAQAMV